MFSMKAFEIHTYQSGKWRIDSVFDDRDLALFEAQRMDESGRYTGIRVIEEIYVESTQETKKPNDLPRQQGRGGKRRTVAQVQADAGQRRQGEEKASGSRSSQSSRQAPKDQEKVQSRAADRDHADHRYCRRCRHVRTELRRRHVKHRICFPSPRQPAKTRRQ